VTVFFARYKYSYLLTYFLRHMNKLRQKTIRDESRQRPLQVFASVLYGALSTLKLDTIVPAGATRYVDR